VTNTLNFKFLSEYVIKFPTLFVPTVREVLDVASTGNLRTKKRESKRSLYVIEHKRGTGIHTLNMADSERLIGGENTSTREFMDNSVENKGCCFKCCHPASGMHRFIVLIFMCLLGFGMELREKYKIHTVLLKLKLIDQSFSGSYFCYDNPGALQDNFIADMDISTAQFAMLYSWYSWPNVVLCFVGGFLLDR